MVTLGRLILLNGADRLDLGERDADLPERVLDAADHTWAASRSRSRTSASSASRSAPSSSSILLFRLTKVGLGLRAAALAPDASRLLGVRVSLDARARLGARGDARRALRDDDRADRVPRPEHDAGDPALRPRGGGARRPGQPDRRGRRRPRRSASSLNLVGTYVDFWGIDLGGQMRLVAGLAIILGVLLVRPDRPVRPRPSRGGSDAPRLEAGAGRAGRRRRLRRRGRPRPARARHLPGVPVRLRRDLLHRDRRPEHPHRLHGPDLARPRRLHGDRRVHDGDPHRRPRLARVWHDPARRPRRRRRGVLFGIPARASRVSTSRSRRSGSRSRRRPCSRSTRASPAVSSARRCRCHDNDWLYYVDWTIALVLLALAWLLLQREARARLPGAPRLGGRRRVLRDRPRRRTRRLAFGVSAFYAGVAGSLLAITVAFVNPDTYPIKLSIFLVVGAVAAGLGSLWGLAVRRRADRVPARCTRRTSRGRPPT